MATLKIKKGDTVKVIAGKDKDKEGKVIAVDSKKNKVYINEINSCPGSLAFYLWEPAGKNFTSLLDEMINIAIKNYRKRNNKTHTFKSNILSGYQGLKGTKGLKGKLR